MSFPRAKRFDEITSCAPPPGYYDPQFDSKVKGCIVVRPDSKKPAVNTPQKDGVNTAESSSSVPVFRTPQPRRKLVTRVRSATTSLHTYEKKDSAVDTEDFDHSDDSRVLEGKLENLTSELQQCRSKCLSLEVQISELEFEKKHLKSKYEQLHVKLEEEENKNNLLKLNEDKYTQLAQELDLMRQNISDQKSEYDLLLNTRDEDLRELRELNDELKKQIENIKVDSELQKVKWESELSKERITNADLESKISQKQQMILMLQGELSSREVEFIDSKAEYEKMIVEHSLEKSALLFEFNKKIELLEKRIHEEEKKNVEQRNSFEEKVSILQVECDNLWKEREEFKTRLDEKDIEISNLTKICETERINKEKLNSFYVQGFNDMFLKLSKFENLHCHMSQFEAQSLTKINAITCRYEELISHFVTMHKNVVKELQSEFDKKLKSVKTDYDKNVCELKDVVLNLKMEKTKLSENLVAVSGEVESVSAKLSLSEDEARQAAATRDELRVSNMEQQLAIVDLQDKLDTITVEHNTCLQTLSKLKNLLEASEDQKRKFEVGNRNLRESLEALGVRLLESERDVEQLSNENKQLEKERIKLLDEVSTCREKIKSQEESLEKLEKDSLMQIEIVRKNLLDKVDFVKFKAVVEEKKRLDMQCEVESFAGVLAAFQEELNQMNEYMMQMASMNDVQTAEIKDLHTKLELSKQELTLAESSLQQQVENYEKRITELSDQLQQSESEVKALAGKLDRQEHCSQQQTRQLTKQLEDTEQEMAALGLVLKEKEQVIRDLKYQVAAYEESNYPEIVSATEKKILELENINLKLTSEMSEFDEHVQTTRAELARTEVMLNEKCHEIEQLQLKFEDMENLLNNKQHEIDTLNQEKAKFMQQKLAGDNELTEVSNNLKKSEVELRNLRSYVNTLEIESKSIKNERIVELEEVVRKLKSKLTTIEEQFKRQLKEYEERASQAEKQCRQLEILVEPFREQLELYLRERGELEKSKDAAEDELRSLSLQYASILGHQNQKQKLKYLVQLQEKNLELRKEVEKLRSQTHAQMVQINKLKAESSKLQRKRSVRSPSKTQNRELSPVLVPLKSKENGDKSPVHHALKGKENSPVLAAFSKGKENSPLKMSPVSSPKALRERGNNV